MKLPGALTRHRGALVVTLVVVGIAVAVFVTVRVGTGGSSAGPRATTTTTTPGRGALGGPVAEELVRLLERSSSVNFDATYNVTDPATGPSTVHLWRRPPLARLDADSGAGDAARRSIQLVTPSGPVACNAEGTGQWSCVAKPGLSLGTLGVVPPTIVAQLAGLDVSAADATVGGEEVRCFTLKPPPGAEGLSGEVCATPDGIPARVVAGTTRLELVSLARGRLPDSVFEPPAPVGG